MRWTKYSPEKSQKSVDELRRNRYWKETMKWMRWDRYSPKERSKESELKREKEWR